MISTVPNKEVVRRISLIHGATYCYLLVKPESSKIRLLMDIKKELIKPVSKELEEWCGMKFTVLIPTISSKEKNEIKKNGEKILPIEKQ